MRSLVLVFTALLGCATAVDQCTKANSGSCCQGYTYNDTPLHKRTTAPVCDGTSIDPVPGKTPPACGGPPNSNGDTMKPVCTEILKIPQGSFHGTLYCGNPLANTGSGTQKGTIDVTIGQCHQTTGFCFILTATAPSGSTLQADYKVQISTSPITSDNPGGFATKVTSQPVEVPFSLIYGSDPCSTGSTTVYIAFHAQTSSQTCWAAIDSSPPYSNLLTIPNNNKNWALQFEFDFTCKDSCNSWCCCPPPPPIPGCPSDYTQSCPGLCNPSKTDAVCNLQHVPNPPGWSANPDYADGDGCGGQICCCQPSGGGTCDTETAFGVPPSCTPHTVCTATTLQSQGCNGNRWGWYIDGVDVSSGQAGPYTLHEGAGNNDLNNGADVGSVMVKPCTSDATKWCAFFSTTGGWVITTAHVQDGCGSLGTGTGNFPCAPGGYNNNGGGSCPASGLPGTSWESQPFVDCPGKVYSVIFHAAVALNDPDCTATNCGNTEP
ncbi:unnamed protein product [Clonostachys rosea f. rosea IK726]|uniref:Uncharacterized protein n=1 Tax=Clonostachys rosea f. rosea IK726 TaxID=1349383 RepID=A0ACA9UP10_BIOOC|nr:unnamed protein product [Clonostachys rosea f. rosea IK726]